jgi:uncharacterized membrane protein
MYKEVICQNCGHIVQVILYPLGDTEGKVGWVFGICPICGEIAYIKRRE